MDVQLRQNLRDISLRLKKVDQLMRKRSCAALIQNNKILMVKHHHDNKIYWTLPGGGLEANESYEEAAVREFFEETGLKVRIVKHLFDEPLLFSKGNNRCFLVEQTCSNNAQLGYDPEEQNLAQEEQMLQDLKWFLLTEVKDDKQVRRVLKSSS